MQTVGEGTEVAGVLVGTVDVAAPDVVELAVVAVLTVVDANREQAMTSVKKKFEPNVFTYMKWRYR